MSNPGLTERAVVKRVLAAAGIVVAAALLGYLLGGIGGEPDVAAPQAVSASPENGRRADVPTAQELDVPFYFFAETRPGADMAAVTEEARLAAASGIHRYAVTSPLPWSGQQEDVDESLSTLDTFLEIDPAARFLVHLDLNPSEAWLAAYPEAAVAVDGRAQPYPCLASEAWLNEVLAGLDALLAAVSHAHGTRVDGYALTCLEEGMWYRNGGYDTSKSNIDGFRRWLTERYATDDALRAAWGDEQVSLGGATIPEPPKTDDTTAVFFELPAQQRQVDYYEYTSETTAQAIAAVAAHIRRFAPDMAVFATYGFSFELLDNAAGHFALAVLLESEIDGFVSPVSHWQRGLGDPGGFMGPVDSATSSGKKWFLIDDTRTGISRDAASGAVERMPGLRPQDIYEVQRRNFAAALAHGLGLVWPDMEGNGALLDPAMWRGFITMQEAYAAEWSEPPTERPVTLLVVVDEKSRFVQQCNLLNRRLLPQLRDCALQAGVPAQFVLLSDVLKRKAPSAPVYLFLNAFALTETERESLHALLAESEAAAIWMYAPGYFAGTASVANVAATTGMNVKAFEKVAKTGSICKLGGRWIQQDEAFGDAEDYLPLFYIEEEETNVIAKYRDSKKTSVYMKPIDSGWTSLFVADPALPSNLLKEILRILEFYPAFRNSTVQAADTAHFGPNTLSIHAKGFGERIVDLGGVFNAQDVLEPDIGWPNKRFLTFPLEDGETRVLRLTPAAPAESAEEPAVDESPEQQPDVAADAESESSGDAAGPSAPAAE